MKILLSVLLFYLSVTTVPVLAETWFTLADYQSLKARDEATAELVLKAMREAVFYAQESTGGAVICASPRAISGAHLIKALDAEITSPTNAAGRAYEADDQAAFVFMHALKNEGFCK